MIVLDTNVLSELLRRQPDPHVLDWFANQALASLFTTTITQAELLFGIKRMAAGRKKQALLDTVNDVMEQQLSGRVLGFDTESAHVYPDVVAHREALGKPISQFDGMIAAVARTQGAMLATRNTKDFTATGLTLVNPWKQNG